MTHTHGNGERSPGSGERSPGSGERSPGSGERSPGSGERSPGSGERSPGSGERSPGNGERSPGSGERSPIILETERLTLRYQQPSDVAPLVDLWADPEVTRHMGGPRDRAWLESALEETACDSYAERYDLWPLIEKETGQVVGDCGLLDKEVEGRQEIELIYVLASSAWGKGYATEIGRALKAYAFEEMGLGRLIALIEPENGASERVAQKVGMRLEKEVVRPGGEVRKVYAVER